MGGVRRLRGFPSNYLVVLRSEKIMDDNDMTIVREKLEGDETTFVCRRHPKRRSCDCRMEVLKYLSEENTR